MYCYKLSHHKRILPFTIHIFTALGFANDLSQMNICVTMHCKGLRLKRLVQLAGNWVFNWVEITWHRFLCALCVCMCVCVCARMEGIAMATRRRTPIRIIACPYIYLATNLSQIHLYGRGHLSKRPLNYFSISIKECIISLNFNKCRKRYYHWNSEHRQLWRLWLKVFQKCFDLFAWILYWYQIYLNALMRFPPCE